MLAGALRGLDVFDALTAGARKGLRVCREILPPLLVLFPLLRLLSVSGLSAYIARLLAPLFSRLGVPPETVTLLLLRPLTGSGAMAAAAGLIERCGADSLIGRTAAVMLGSSETTFYVGGKKQPLGDPGGSVRGSGLLSLLGLALPPVLGVVKALKK